MTSCVTYTMQLPYFTKYGLSTGLGLCVSVDSDWPNMILIGSLAFPPIIPRSSQRCCFSPTCFSSSPLCPTPFFFCQVLLFLRLIYLYPGSSWLSSSSMAPLWWPPNLCQCGSMVSRCPLPDSPPNMHGTWLIYLPFLYTVTLSMGNCNPTW